MTPDELKEQQLKASLAAGLPMSQEFDAVESACKQHIHNSRPRLARTGELGKGKAMKAKRDAFLGKWLLTILTLVGLVCGVLTVLALTWGL